MNDHVRSLIGRVEELQAEGVSRELTLRELRELDHIQQQLKAALRKLLEQEEDSIHGKRAD